MTAGTMRRGPRASAVAFLVAVTVVSVYTALMVLTAPSSSSVAAAAAAASLAAEIPPGDGSGNSGISITRRTLYYPDQLTLLAFGSCHKNKYADLYYPDLWQTIDNSSFVVGNSSSDDATTNSMRKPQAFVWAGDAVYGPKGVAAPQQLQVEYDALLRSPSYRSFLGDDEIADVSENGGNRKKRKKVILGTWDDHDYGANDGGKDVPDRRERRQLFRQFIGPSQQQLQQQLDDTDDDDDDDDGLYMSAVFGGGNSSGNSSNAGVQIILLDTRHNRDAHCWIPSVAASRHPPPLAAGIACLTRWLVAGLTRYSPASAPSLFSSWCFGEERQMLGEKQWSWLEDQLSLGDDGGDVGQIAIRIVVSSVQVLTTNPAMESWGQFPAQQRRLVELLRKASGTVLVLSGKFCSHRIVGGCRSIVVVQYFHKNSQVELSVPLHETKVTFITAKSSPRTGGGLRKLLASMTTTRNLSPLSKLPVQG